LYNVSRKESDFDYRTGFGFGFGAKISLGLLEVNYEILTKSYHMQGSGFDRNGENSEIVVVRNQLGAGLPIFGKLAIHGSISHNLIVSKDPDFGRLAPNLIFPEWNPNQKQQWLGAQVGLRYAIHSN